MTRMTRGIRRRYDRLLTLITCVWSKTHLTGEPMSIAALYYIGIDGEGHLDLDGDTFVRTRLNDC